MTKLLAPDTDPTPIFELFRGNYAAELLTAAVAHFDIFGRLARSPAGEAELGRALGLAERPLTVLLCALRAFGLLSKDARGQLTLTETARAHLVPGAAHDVGDYIGLAAQAPGVLALVERLRTNRPAGADGAGAAFIYRDGVASAMEQEDSARHFTLALAGRAKNVAPLLAARLSPLPACAADVVARDCATLLDVAGGTGIYSIAFLQLDPRLRAIVLDRPEVLKVARAMAEQHQVAERLECRSGDMFRDPFPAADAILLSNVLHDWDAPQCRELIQKCAGALNPGGQLLIHDVFLNDALDGPLPIALYSVALFCLTEGRAYSGAEYRDWLHAAGLRAGAATPTLIHCGVLVGVKASGPIV